MDADVLPKLARHHLNEAKLDLFVFKGRSQVRLQKVNAGGILGAHEFGVFHVGGSAALQPRRVVEAIAAPRCHVFREPFASMRQALRSDPAVGQPVKEWLARETPRQMIELLKKHIHEAVPRFAGHQPTFFLANDEERNFPTY